MKFDISNLPVSLDAMLPGNEDLLKREIARAIGVKPAEVTDLELTRKSVDARKKSHVHFVLTCVVDLPRRKSLEPQRGVQAVPHEERPPRKTPDLSVAFKKRGAISPVVVGSGPAGLFCALELAASGLQPLVIERGAQVEERVRAVEAFNAGAPLNPETNIQFGEGGAGTFSDGKLNTGIKSPHIRQVLRTFADMGASQSILVDAKPHIGTDVLVAVVAHLRQRIESLGGRFCFNTRMDKILIENDRVKGIEVTDLKTGRTYEQPTDCVVLACGHSARDTFSMLQELGLILTRKPFAVGVRIEHPQAMINEAQYGTAAQHPALGAADYKLAVKTRQGRGVYTFCMCPGGEVVAAASEEGGVCVNGMSRAAREGKNANSALLVSIEPDDLPGKDPLEGVALQRRLERSAFDLGRRNGSADFTAPAQTVGDFSERRAGGPSDWVGPTYPRSVAWCDLHECFPPLITDALHEALPLLDRKLRGFADPRAVMTAVEARSSSPVRIMRDQAFQAQRPSRLGGPGESAAVIGLYPCGEGAGYAGGIMSAAVDGMRVAEAIQKTYCSRKEERATS